MSVTLPAFDLLYWYLQFPSPQIASVTSLDASTVRVECAWADLDQLIQLVWDSADSFDHPNFKYTTATDYLGLVWRFSVTIPANVIPFDENNGLTLTIITGDGVNHFVRLWNYKTAGTNLSATFAVPFSTVKAGFFADDPIDCSDVTEMFLTFANAQYGAGVKLADPEYSAITIQQTGSTGSLTVATAAFTPTGVEMTLDYDDLYHLNPLRIVNQIAGLGYVRFATCYIGMSHFMRLGWKASEARFGYTLKTLPINLASLAWLTDLYARLKTAGLTLIFSMSYEMLYNYIPHEWCQLTWDGAPALTGWVPPSSLFAFTRADVIEHLENTAAQLLTIPAAADAKYFQIGEPWWWDGSFSDHQPCFYDLTTQALYFARYGQAMYHFTTLNDPLTDANAIRTASFLAAQLGQSTQTLAASARAAAAHVKVGLLFFTTQAFAANVTKAVNYPASYWASPTFDLLQLEAYDDVIAGLIDTEQAEVNLVVAQLRYGLNVHYFGGFVLNHSDAATIWPRIYAALRAAYHAGILHLAIWSYSQIVRDGIILPNLFTTLDTATADPQLILRVSNDGGMTFGNERQAAMGKMGNYTQLARWRQLGRSRDRVFEVICSDAVEVALIEADLDAHG